MTVRVQSITKGELTRLLYTCEVKTAASSRGRVKGGRREPSGRLPPRRAASSATAGFYFPFFNEKWRCQQ